MKVIYRISDTGYSKVKPKFINNESCLKNFCDVFCDHIHDVRVIADNCSEATMAVIKRFINPAHITQVSVGSGAGTFNLALDKALGWEDQEIVYFVENDYWHKQKAPSILQEGFNLGAAFVTLYDHPDKYLDPTLGGNPYCEGGAEDTRVHLTQSCHWKITNSTTMTFASKVQILKQVESILRKHTSGTYPNDFSMFIELRDRGKLLISSIPGYATHGETAWLAPLTDWSKI